VWPRLFIYSAWPAKATRGAQVKGVGTLFAQLRRERTVFYDNSLALLIRHEWRMKYFFQGEYEMSENRTPGYTASTGDTDAGTTRGSNSGASGSGNSGQSLTPTGGQNTGGGSTGTATGRAEDKGYGAKLAGAASTAKDFVTDKVSVIGDKLADLKNTDIKEVATQAKDYAQKNPGQAILISAAAGLVLGMLIRGSRR
jgi:ElaB/YqjD/DUF883 family membrane-anchored ribosome-binding protein